MEKWNMMYDLILELLRKNKDNNLHGMYGCPEQSTIICSTETQANVIADLLEDCGYDTMHTWEFPDKSGWCVYPDGV